MSSVRRFLVLNPRRALRGLGTSRSFSWRVPRLIIATTIVVTRRDAAPCIAMSSSHKGNEGIRKTQTNMKKPRTLLGYFGPKQSSSEGEESCVAKKPTTALHQTSIPSFFSTPSITTTKAAVSSFFPRTPPSIPTPLSPKTPPTPDSVYMGTPSSTATAAHKSTPPTPVEFGSCKRPPYSVMKPITYGTPYSRTIDGETKNMVSTRFGTPLSSIPESPSIGEGEEESTQPKEFGTPTIDPPQPRKGTEKEVSNQIVTGTPESDPPGSIGAASDVDSPTLKAVGKRERSEPPERGETTVGSNNIQNETTLLQSINSDSNSGSSQPRKRQKNKPLQQLYLDFGQENFAKRSICKTCGMLYVHGLSEDSQQHSRICANHVKGVPFQTPHGRVVTNHPPSGSIVEIRPTDSYALRQKLVQVKNIVDQELGFASVNGPVSRTAYLYIVDKRVVGMSTAEIISEAYLLGRTNLERSRESRRAIVGIHQLWVHSEFRQQGIATRLVDAVRSKLVFGQTVSPEFVAFSSPTEAGANFARRYLESFEEGDTAQSTVLVYDCQ